MSYPSNDSEDREIEYQGNEHPYPRNNSGDISEKIYVRRKSDASKKDKSEDESMKSSDGVSDKGRVFEVRNKMAKYDSRKKKDSWKVEYEEEKVSEYSSEDKNKDDRGLTNKKIGERNQDKDEPKIKRSDGSLDEEENEYKSEDWVDDISESENSDELYMSELEDSDEKKSISIVDRSSKIAQSNLSRVQRIIDRKDEISEKKILIKKGVSKNKKEQKKTPIVEKEKKSEKPRKGKKSKHRKAIGEVLGVSIEKEKGKHEDKKVKSKKGKPQKAGEIRYKISAKSASESESKSASASESKSPEELSISIKEKGKNKKRQKKKIPIKQEKKKTNRFLILKYNEAISQFTRETNTRKKPHSVIIDRLFIDINVFNKKLSKLRNSDRSLLYFVILLSLTFMIGFIFFLITFIITQTIELNDQKEQQAVYSSSVFELLVGISSNAFTFIVVLFRLLTIYKNHQKKQNLLMKNQYSMILHVHASLYDDVKITMTDRCDQIFLMV